MGWSTVSRLGYTPPTIPENDDMRSDKAASTRRVYVYFLLVLSFLPALLLCYLVPRYWVDVPYQDEWDAFGRVFERYCDGTLTVFDFFVQHNESRKAFPRLLAFGVGLINGWSPRGEMCITWLIAAASSGCIFLLLRRLRGVTSEAGTWILFVLINLVLFSPVQYRNWLWGDQMIRYIPGLMLMAGLVVQTSRVSIGKKALAGILFSFISTFSFVSGMSVWLFLFPFNEWLRDGGEPAPRQRRDIVKWLVVYILFCALSLGIYFWNYEQPARHPSVFAAFARPREAILYVLILFGAPFVPEKSPLAPVMTAVIGALLLSLFLVVTGYCLLDTRRRKERLLLVYPFLVIGLYSIVNALAVTLGRVGVGFERAFLVPYMPASIGLIISVLVLSQLVYVVSRPSWNAGTRKGVAWVLGTVMLLALGLQAHVYPLSLKQMESFRQTLETGKEGIQFYPLVPDKEKVRLVYGGAQRAAGLAEKLSECGMFPFAPVDADLIRGQLAGAAERETEATGDFEECRMSRDGGLDVVGWAMHATDRERGAEYVLLTYSVDSRQAVPFAVVRVMEERPDVPGVRRDGRLLQCGFRREVGTENLPKGRLVVRAWSIDPENNKIAQLRGRHGIDR